MDVVANGAKAVGGAPFSERARAARRTPEPMRRILLCVDRSSLAEAGVPHAVLLAKAFRSPITILHVMQPPQDARGPRTMTDAVGWELSRQEAASYLEHLRADVAAASGQPVEVVLEQGHPAERIEALCRHIGADLMILSSHGEGGAGAWNLGSTVQQVLAVAKGSVLVARSRAPRNATRPRRILVPLDGSIRTESVLPTAARMAGAAGAEVLLVHIVVEPAPNRVLVSSDDVAMAQELAGRLERCAKHYLDHLAEQLLRDVPVVRTLVKRQADEGRGLLDVIEREGIDLVVLSAHGASCDPARTFGSVTAQLLWHSPAPLLVIQDLEEAGLGSARYGDELSPPSPRGSFVEDAT